MGYDLYGVHATAETGEYFRNSVWWWHPLAQYVLDIVDMPEAERHAWHANSGQQVSARTATQIATALHAKLTSGEVQQYAEDYAKALDALPMLPCRLCHGSGERHDDIVQGQCNACDGAGKVKDWGTHYPFDEENVKAFAEFCAESGGFVIW